MVRQEQHVIIGDTVYKYEYVIMNGVWSNEPICVGKMPYDKYVKLFSKES